MNWSLTGAILMALAVGLGAFGAHGLRDRLDAYSMSVYEKAVFYHFIHRSACSSFPISPRRGRSRCPPPPRCAPCCWRALIIFSGSLYLLAVTGNRWLGAITPIGGLSFIAAWLLLAWYSIRW